MIWIAIVDDHPLALHGVEYMLAEVEDIKIAAAASSMAQLRAQMAELPADRTVDVIVLDLYHDGDGPCIDSVAQLALSNRVLVMSASGRPDDVTGAIRAGACGYVTKSTPLPVFRTAIYTAAAGGFWLSSQLADILCAQSSRPQVPPGSPRSPGGLPPLAPREEEALALIARGLTHAQVATRMGISRATVDTYVERIRTKLQLGNKAELTRAALARAAQRERGDGP